MNLSKKSLGLSVQRFFCSFLSDDFEEALLGNLMFQEEDDISDLESGPVPNFADFDDDETNTKIPTFTDFDENITSSRRGRKGRQRSSVHIYEDAGVGI